jgi:hypothetical protein
MTTCCKRSGFCDIQMNGSTIQCPCLKCLIKPICETICDDLNNYYRSIFHFDHEEMEWQNSD